MDDLEIQDIYLQISEGLDGIDEIMDNHDVDVEDEPFAEIADLMSRLRSIVTTEV